jgi:hypothetical protein
MKADLMKQFRANHEELVEYISRLSDVAFVTSANDKWTPGQQLEHVYLCLVPMAKVLPSKEYMLVKFGAIDRNVWDDDEVIKTYKAALAAGGKAPEKFVPEAVSIERKPSLVDDTTQILDAIDQALASYTEEELDTLTLPHPLLGKLTIREFFFMMAYHATHHLQQTKVNLVV